MRKNWGLKFCAPTPSPPGEGAGRGGGGEGGAWNRYATMYAYMRAFVHATPGRKRINVSGIAWGVTRGSSPVCRTQFRVVANGKHYPYLPTARRRTDMASAKSLMRRPLVCAHAGHDRVASDRSHRQRTVAIFCCLTLPRFGFGKDLPGGG